MNKILIALAITMMLMPMASASDFDTNCINKTHLQSVYNKPLINQTEPIISYFKCTHGCDLNNDKCFGPPVDNSGQTITLLTMTSISVPLFIIAMFVFFLWPALSLRFKMMGRKNKGYMVFNVLDKTGKKTPYPHKAELSFRIGKMMFKPKYEKKYIYRNEYDMPCMDFDARNINPDDKENPLEQMTRPEGTKEITPEELLNMNLGFFEMGLLKANKDYDKILQQMQMLLIGMGLVAIIAISVALKVFEVVK